MTMQLSRDQLTRAYRDMRTIREFEERVHREAPRGEIAGSVHLYAGEEASAVGVCMHLDDEDVIATTHRGHGHAIAKGCDVTAMMCELYGREGGICNAKGGSLHLADLERGMLGANGIIGAGAPLACGAALTAKTKGSGGVAVAFIGDGGINQGATAESLNLATVWALPVVFVIEDNGYGEAMASEWATGGSIVKRAAGFGVRAVKVDGVDFFAVHEAAGEALARARGGEGPTLIHCELSRFYGHYEGEAQTYRGPGEVERLRRERDPLTVFQTRVTEAGLLDAAALTAVDAEVETLIEDAVTTAQAAPPPPIESLLTDVYVSY